MYQGNSREKAQKAQSRESRVVPIQDALEEVFRVI